MERRNSNLFNALKFFLFYVLIVQLGTPIVVYLISFLVENYLLGWNVTFESITNNGVVDDTILILSNLFIILLFIKKRYTSVNESCSRKAIASFDKGLLLWILILQLSSILPINLFVAGLDLNDYEFVLSDDRLSIASIVGGCLLAPLAEELVFRGSIEESLLRWKPNAALAIVLSSLLFGVLHLYPSLIIGAFLIGLLVGWVYYLTRNVLVCFLMHMVNNIAGCLSKWLAPDDCTPYDVLFQTHVIIITLFSIAFMIASLVAIKNKTSRKA